MMVVMVVLVMDYTTHLFPFSLRSPVIIIIIIGTMYLLFQQHANPTHRYHRHQPINRSNNQTSNPPFLSPGPDGKGSGVKERAAAVAGAGGSCSEEVLAAVG